jgi:hypothetical protein
MMEETGEGVNDMMARKREGKREREGKRYDGKSLEQFLVLSLSTGP